MFLLTPPFPPHSMLWCGRGHPYERTKKSVAPFSFVTTFNIDIGGRGAATVVPAHRRLQSEVRKHVFAMASPYDFFVHHLTYFASGSGRASGWQAMTTFNIEIGGAGGRPKIGHTCCVTCCGFTCDISSFYRHDMASFLRKPCPARVAGRFRVPRIHRGWRRTNWTGMDVEE